MMNSHLGTLCFFLSLLSLANLSLSQTGLVDSTMQALKSSLNLTSDVDCLTLTLVNGNLFNVTAVIGLLGFNLNRKAVLVLFLPIFRISELIVIDLFLNRISGPIPDLSALSRLHDNLFDFVPNNLFLGMNSLQQVFLENNPFSPWEIPQTIKEATSLQNLTLSNCSITGNIPDFFGSQSLPSLTNLKLSQNYLQGELPGSLAGFSLQSLFLNGQLGEAKLNGSISILHNLTCG